jgi:hypothetical protein
MRSVDRAAADLINNPFSDLQRPLTVDVVHVFAVSAEGNPGEEVTRCRDGEATSVVLQELTVACSNRSFNNTLVGVRFSKALSVHYVH